MTKQFFFVAFLSVSVFLLPLSIPVRAEAKAPESATAEASGGPDTLNSVLDFFLGARQAQKQGAKASIIDRFTVYYFGLGIFDFLYHTISFVAYVASAGRGDEASLDVDSGDGTAGVDGEEGSEEGKAPQFAIRYFGLGAFDVAYQTLLLASGGSILDLLGFGEQEEEEFAYPVRTRTIHSEMHAVRLPYIGTTMTDGMKRYSFKIPGKIISIPVKKGDKVSKGQLLARLESKERDWQKKVAELDQVQANSAANALCKLFNKLQGLAAEGAVSQIQVEKARVECQVMRAKAAQAKVGVEYGGSVVSDTEMHTEIDGYVIEITMNEGELIGPGMPVVVVRSESQIIQVGVSQSDIKTIKLGMKAVVSVDNVVGVGKVTNIAQIPDLMSRTYNVQVTLTGKLSDMDFFLGQISHVSFEIGKEESIWIPIQSLMSDGIDYVYTVEDGRAVRRNVTRGSMSGDLVQVDGIEDGVQLVTEGMTALKEGYVVTVKTDEPDAGKEGVTQKFEGRGDNP